MLLQEHNWDNFTSTLVPILRELKCKPYTIGKVFKSTFQHLKQFIIQNFVEKVIVIFPQGVYAEISKDTDHAWVTA